MSSRLLTTYCVAQELKQLLAVACHKGSRLLVVGVANAFTLVEEHAQELNLAVGCHVVSCTLHRR
jgi:alpha-L-arabinofuranosidase